MIRIRTWFRPVFSSSSWWLGSQVLLKNTFLYLGVLITFNLVIERKRPHWGLKLMSRTLVQFTRKLWFAGDMLLANGKVHSYFPVLIVLCIYIPRRKPQSWRDADGGEDIEQRLLGQGRIWTFWHPGCIATLLSQPNIFFFFFFRCINDSDSVFFLMFCFLFNWQIAIVYIYGVYCDVIEYSVDLQIYGVQCDSTCILSGMIN